MDNKQTIQPNEQPVSQENLIQYLQGSLPTSEIERIEQQMEDDAFLNDALEGLHQLRDAQQIKVVVEDLNQSIQEQVAARKHRRKKSPILSSFWVYVAIILLLILILSAYLIISLAMLNK